jgi:Cu+-exporting ATPase
MSKTLSEVSLPISGMSCASCVSHVEGALKELPGVSTVLVNLATNKANLTYDPQLASLEDMRRAVDDVGYAIANTEITLDIRGMTCASCVAHVEGALKELQGVQNAVVNLGLNTARVTYIPGLVSTTAMKRAVQAVGYEAQERSEGVDALDREKNAREEEIKIQGRNLIIAGIIGLVVMIGTFYDMLGPLKAYVPEFLSYKWVIG